MPYKDPIKERECQKKYHAKRYRENLEENRKNARENGRLHRLSNPKKIWARGSLSSHKIRGHIIAMTIDELLVKVKEIKGCPYCRKEIKFKYGQGINGNTPTLDRINDDKIINKNNTQIICYSCNATKRNRTHKEFVEYCSQISQRFAE